MNKDVPLDVIKGTVERIVFHSEETGFTVLRINAPGYPEPVTMVGNIPEVMVGETVHAHGRWVINKQYGREFHVESVRLVPPESMEGIEKFLASGLIKGIGPVYAKRLCEKFGTRIFEIIEKESVRLEEVEGIGKVRRQLIKQSWEQTRTIRNIMTFLLEHGITTARAFRIYKFYGEEAIQRIKADPYCLARDIKGIGFKTADNIAQKLGIEKTSDIRARAGVEYVLLEISSDGHCACPRHVLVEKASKILEIPPDIIEQAIDHDIEAGRLVMDTIGPAPSHRLIFLAHLYRAEYELAERLKNLLLGEHPASISNIDKAIEWSEKQIGLKLADAQCQAMKTALTNKVTVITGGPGVGKTTLINAILKVFSAKKLETLLCAPTGRAAKRMTEATGHPAKTIHRLLEYDPSTGRFKRNVENPLEADAIIVDEVSMIDLPLACSLLRAISPHSALILVGDADQLPSVGPGAVLRDIIKSNVFPVVRLSHVFRQAARSLIVTNAHRINEGRFPFLNKNENSDFVFFEIEDPARAAEMVVQLVSQTIPKQYGFDSMQDIQVIIPMRRGELGVYNLNSLLQNTLNPHGESVERFGVTFRTGDRVMQIENDYEKDVFNGDIGFISQINKEERFLTVHYEHADVTYDFEELDEIMPSYAITVHKSQGSEYPCVIVPIHTQHYALLQRNLLYTAVTRGKKLVVLVGTKKALAIALRKGEASRRITTLATRLARTNEKQFYETDYEFSEISNLSEELFE
jgi:exodeoxyribonuclease V alpha subunit